MLKVVSQIQTATGEYGNLKSEVTRNGDVTTVAISAKPKGNVIEATIGAVTGGGTYLPKYHFTDVEEMKHLRDAINDAITFLGGE